MYERDICLRKLLCQMGCLFWLLFAVRTPTSPKELSAEFENRFEEAKLDVFYEQK